MLLTFSSFGNINAKQKSVLEEQYNFCLNNLTRPNALNLIDKLFRNAQAAKNPEMQCRALNLRSEYAYNHHNIRMLKEEKLRTDRFTSGKSALRKYYYMAWDWIINYHLNYSNFKQASEEVRLYQIQALREQSNYGINYSHRKMGDIFFKQGLNDEALKQYNQGLNGFGRHADNEIMFSFLTQIGNTYYSMQRYKDAQATFIKAMPYAHDCKDLISVYALIAMMKMEQGSADNAKPFLDKADNIAGSISSKVQKGNIYYIAHSCYSRMKKDYKSALAFADSIYDPINRSFYQKSVFVAQKDYPDALKYSEKHIHLQDSLMFDENASLLSDYASRFDNEMLLSQVMRFKLQNTEMRLQQSENQKTLLLLQKGQYRLTLRNKNLLLGRTKMMMARSKEKAARMAALADANKKKGYLIITVILLVAAVVYISFDLYMDRKLRTAKRRAEEAQKRAESADKMKTAFIQNMSHEIRTPLNAIVGFTDVLNDMPDAIDETQHQEFVRLIHKNTQLLTSLINDILDLSILDSDNYKVQLVEGIRIADLCQATIDTVRQRVADGVTLRLLPPEDDRI